MRHLPPEVRFAQRTERQGECLIWTGTKRTTGYGEMSVDGKPWLIHRWAYVQAHGPIPDGKHVDHVCHNKLCVEPLHLRAVTPAQNAYNHPGARRGRDLPRNVYRTPSGRYVVIVRKDGRGRNFGTYGTPEEAAMAAAEARLKLFGPYAGKG